MDNDKLKPKKNDEDDVAFKQLYINELKDKVKKKLEVTDPDVMKAFKLFMTDDSDKK